MNLLRDFPELNSGQINMLERYISEREQQAVEKFRKTFKK